MIKRAFVLFAAGVLSLYNASAQGSALEIMGGYSVQPYSLKGEARSAQGAFNGTNAFLRYTYFLSGRIGLFAQIGSECVYGSKSSFFGVMNRADGQKYMYRFSSSDGYESVLSEYRIGAAYRWDSGFFRFTPRLAVGIGSYTGYDYSYERRSRNGDAGPEYFSFVPVRKTVSYDYLIDERDVYITPTTMLVSADFQISAKLGGRFSLFVEPGVTVAPFRINVEYSRCGSVPRFNPTNWPEAVAYSGMEGTWSRNDDSTVTSVDPAFVSPFFHINVGIGIHFGSKQ